MASLMGRAGRGPLRLVSNAGFAKPFQCPYKDKKFMFSSSFPPLDATIGSAVGAPYRHRVEIAVIDTSLSDWHTLRDGVKAGTEVMLIGGREDGLLALARALEERRGISAIHVLSHGFPGGFTLGSARLDASSVTRYAPALAAIGASLSDDADILIYSCRTASGEGPALLSALSALTGAERRRIPYPDRRVGAGWRLGAWLPFGSHRVGRRPDGCGDAKLPTYTVRFPNRP